MKTKELQFNMNKKLVVTRAIPNADNITNRNTLTPKTSKQSFDVKKI